MVERRRQLLPTWPPPATTSPSLSPTLVHWNVQQLLVARRSGKSVAHFVFSLFGFHSVVPTTGTASLLVS